MAVRIRRIKACLNGRREPAEHPAVPVTPAELGRAARDAVAAGAEALHIHPRGGDGLESLRADDVGATVAALRAACPGVPVGVTTGLWAVADVAERQGLITGWAVLDRRQRPDFASVNLSEDGWQELARALAAAGVAAEAGVWSVDDADQAARQPPPGGWLRILVEIPPDQAPDQAEPILARLAAGGAGGPVLLHGEDGNCWPLIARAGRLGLPTRIGLEDVTAGPSGEPVTGNGELVRLAGAIWDAAAGT
jgi:uncharacterized protein (DUF849 family)